MNQSEMIQSLRAEIAKLQRVLDLLLDGPGNPGGVRRAGGPKQPSDRATSLNAAEFAPQKRAMSAEGKARIAAAQRKRWAAQKGTSAGSTPAKKVAPAKRTSKAASAKSGGRVASATAKKSAGAGKRAGSAQVATAKRSTKSSTKKTAAKKTVRAPTKRLAKQAAGATQDVQSTA